MMILGWPGGTRQSAAGHLRWLKRGEEATALLAPDRRLRFLVNRASALLLLGQESGWTVAAQFPGEAATAADRLQLARASLNTGDAAMMWGRYAEAGRWLAKGLDLASRHRYPTLRDQMLVTQAHLDWFTGAWDGLAGRARALAASEELVAVARAEAALVEGLLRVAREDRAQASASLAGVAEEMRRHGAVEYWMETDAALARLRLAERDPGAALTATDEAIATVIAKDIWLWATEVAPVRVEALAAAGRPDEAARLAEAFARGLRDCAAQASRTALIECRAILAQARADQAGAAGLFGRAAAGWQSLSRPYAALLARERQARCLLAGDRADAGTATLREVWRDLSGLGARTDAARVAQALHERGTDVQPPARGRPSYGNQLSPRELAVVRLLVGGRTNRQIADALVVSVQTVASHLHSAMRKLQVPSRTALAVSAVEQGLVRATPPPD
jgi:DNA-binding CsgD family transcriptional regulator